METTICSKLSATTVERIALLAELNRRHKLALGKRDKKALNKLAREYEAIGCKRLADDIRNEGKSILPIRATKSRMA